MLYKLIIIYFIFVSYKADGKPKLSSDRKVFKNIYGTEDGNIRDGDAGDPLILTDLIEQGKIEEAQQAAKVDFDGFFGVKSYSGFLTVDKTFSSNLFFWFFPSESNPKTDPVVVWLQGGPGSSSMFGLFVENGPLTFDARGNLQLRKESWSKQHSVLYFDQPAGTGFSFTKGGQAKNQTKVGADLYEALQQFFKLFPDYQSNDFFLTGESYAGKYIPALGHTIWKNNPSADLKINLQGLAIGNGWSVPEVQLRYADFLFDHGLIDWHIKARMDEIENKAVELIQAGRYEEAEDLLEDDFSGRMSLFVKATGYQNVYNILYASGGFADDANINNLFRREDIRKAIHVGNVPYNEDAVYDNLYDDIPQSVAPLLVDLINNYRVLLYSGQLDLIVPYPMTIKYLRNLKFDELDDYKKAKRVVWYPNNNTTDIAGYVKSTGKFTDILVRDAGHIVPQDQPVYALDLITRFVRNESFELPQSM